MGKIKTITVEVRICSECPVCFEWRDHGSSTRHCKILNNKDVGDYIRQRKLPHECPLQDKPIL